MRGKHGSVCKYIHLIRLFVSRHHHRRRRHEYEHEYEHEHRDTLQLDRIVATTN